MCTYWVVGWERLRLKRKRRREKWRWWRFLTSGSDDGGALRLWARWGAQVINECELRVEEWERWRCWREDMYAMLYYCSRREEKIIAWESWCGRESPSQKEGDWEREREVVWVLGEKAQMVGGTGPTTLQNDCDRWVPTRWIVSSPFKQTNPLISLIFYFLFYFTSHIFNSFSNI